MQAAHVTDAKATASPLMLAAVSLAKRELVRFLRQRSRIIGALATPPIFWLFIGSGLNRSFQPAESGLGSPGSGLGEIARTGPNPQSAIRNPKSGYLAYFFPGSLVLVVLFTAIFSTISIIEDRNAGFLQGILVAPVSRTAIVLGKVLGGTVLATGQGLLFLALAPLAGIKLSVAGTLGAIVLIGLIAFALTSMGVVLAWRMDSSAGFHSIMNLLLMPMWVLSGAVFPTEGASAWLAWIVRVNPLSYGVAGVRHLLANSGTAFAGMTLATVVTLAFAGVMFLLAVAIVRLPRGNLT